MKKLTHIDLKGKANMVDVGSKPVMSRVAKARGHIRLTPETIDLIKDNQLSKGDVLSIAMFAGINASKQTSDLIPLCHNIVLDHTKVELMTDKTGIYVESEVRCEARTGVEMEALMAVSIALLTVYDMCKAVDKQMVIENIELLEKTKNGISKKN